MVIEGFVWLEWVIEKLLLKHNVTIDEVEQVFRNRPTFLKRAKGKVAGEHLYNALGQTNSGRYLSVYFIYKMNKQALIVSARNMNKKERRSCAKK